MIEISDEVIPRIILWWSLLFVIPYQWFVMRQWARTHPKNIYLSDLLKGLPFGLIIILALIMVYIGYHAGKLFKFLRDKKNASL